MLRERDTNRAWARAEVAGEPVDTKVWEGQPHKAFRKCFVSALTRSGADREAVEFLVGHDLGSVRKRYLDDEFLAVREAVDLIPPLVTSSPSLADA